jgi:hypothetical protein
MTDEYEEDFVAEEDGGSDGWKVIDVTELELDNKPLGGGGFALVYRGTWRGQAVAVKTLVRIGSCGSASVRTASAITGTEFCACLPLRANSSTPK